MVGTMLGNFVALVFLIVVGLLGIISTEVSSYGFLVVSYGFWALTLLANLSVGRAISPQLSSELSSDELLIYRLFNIAIRAPGAGQLLSAYFNFVRLVGLLWGGYCLWKGLYAQGGFIIVFFFVSSALIVRLNPYLYMGAEARRGNIDAISQLSLIESIAEKRASVYQTG